MITKPLRILLADDDDGDRVLFTEALRELAVPTYLTTVDDGEQLIDYLISNTTQLPHLLFLDLNMPRKNGFECLTEIKQQAQLKSLPVIIFSTSDEEKGIDETYAGGANLYVVKPGNFPHLVKSLRQAIILSVETNFVQLPKDKFVLNSTETL